MKLLIDMNLSPNWVEALKSEGLEAVHWSTIGNPRAADSEIMAWARSNGYVVFTHDLDFGMLLAVTQAQGPSVIQVRTQDVMPDALGARILQVLLNYTAALEKGALITVDVDRLRIRLLPFA